MDPHEPCVVVGVSPSLADLALTGIAAARRSSLRALLRDVERFGARTS